VTIYTIGHSTHTLDDFLALLDAHRIRQLADVRTVPRSRRHPQFVREAMQVSLPRAGVAYRHMGGLGGLRKPRPHSPNTAWRNESFRGYADFMQTDEFSRALDDLIAWATGGGEGAAPDAEARHDTREADVSGPRTAIMCAEAVWWRCHRQLIADALVARDIEVCHITSRSAASAHTLTSFARVDKGRVTYPGLL
jgi:uncharacterized protein (DUF488 family)